jgi:hypothetical protein
MAPKVFKLSQRIRHKNLIEIGEYAKRDVQLFALHEEVSEYAKCIKRTWRIRQWYFAVFSLYANPHEPEPISATFNQYKKVEMLVHLSMKGLMVEKNHLTLLSL